MSIRSLGLIIVVGITILCVFAFPDNRSSGQKPLQELNVPGRYQLVPSNNKEDVFFVIDTSSGQVWGYTSRFTPGFNWTDFGKPTQPGVKPESSPPPKKAEK
jgi:hypothetical protein